MSGVSLNDVLLVAVRAGEAILAVYHSGADLQVESKSDDSPLTEADRASNAIIIAGLQALAPEIPVISEETLLPDFEERRHWTRFWLVDPLDGTREFISRNGEFTVNIALVEDGVPVLGVVYVPVTGKVYAGGRDLGAWTGRAGEALSTMRVRPLSQASITVVGSRRHGAETLDALMKTLAGRFATTSLANLGSSLKFCLLAEGAADFYPRMTPVSEWDAAAAHAVLNAAGGEVLGEDFQPLRYNRRESVIVPRFIAVADTATDWSAMVSFD